MHERGWINEIYKKRRQFPPPGWRVMRSWTDSLGNKVSVVAPIRGEALHDKTVCKMAAWASPEMHAEECPARVRGATWSEE